MQFKVSIQFSGSTFNDTQYTEALQSVVSGKGCGTCGDLRASPVQCDRCSIEVTVTFGAARRLLALSAMVDTKITTRDQGVATAVAQELNTTKALNAIQARVGGLVVFVQTPQVVVQVVNAPPSDGSVVVLVAALVAGLVLVALIVVVLVFALRQPAVIRPPYPPQYPYPQQLVYVPPAPGTYPGQPALPSAPTAPGLPVTPRTNIQVGQPRAPGPVLGYRMVPRQPEARQDPRLSAPVSYDPVRPGQLVYRMNG